MTRKVTRRNILAASAAVAAGSFITPVRGAPPAARAITPALIEAAKKEGKLSWYTRSLPVAEKIAGLPAKYPA